MSEHSLLYVDCPWSYRDKANAGNRGAEFKYPCMTLQQLIEMRSYVDSIALPDSVMYMWTTAPMMQDALTLMNAWGFVFKTVAFVWIKTNKKNINKTLNTGQPLYLATYIDENGALITHGDFMSLGHHTRSNAEFVLLGVRGKGLKRVDASVRSTVIAPVREHSRKPDEVRDRLEQLYGDVPRIEMFARERADGWDYHGLEVKW